jgi:hypothetical protein
MRDSETQATTFAVGRSDSPYCVDTLSSPEKGARDGRDPVQSDPDVEEIPANVLIGRDGRIVAVAQSGDDLERAVVRALCCLQFSDFK